MTKKDELLYDVRIAERSIREGTLTKKEYDKHLKDLPDVVEKGEILIIEEDIEVSAEGEIEAEADTETEIVEVEEEETQ